ncbi:MAG: zinc-binding dehydrogenase, partial [Ktedonobacteraceae bacterium]|nr:zinc-binding dehydrogenase [Ktedonobacteraceae bacterium]
VLARHSFQIEQATRLGATHIIYPQDSYTGIQRATDAQLHKGMFGNQTLLGGYDVIFDTVGTQKTLHHTLRWARARATVVLVGVNLHLMHIDLTPIWYREVNLIGSIGSSVENWPLGTNERRSTFEVALELIQHDQIHPEHLITHRFPLNNYRTALLTATGKAESHAIKVVFDYSLLPPSVVPNVRASAFRKQRSTFPIDESTSTAENGTTAEGTPSSTQSAEPATSVAPLSPLFSSSQTVAPPREDDEFDEMEDTIPAPAIAKHNRPAPAPEQAQKRSSDQEEDFRSLPAVPAMPEGGLINHGLINRAPTDFEENIPQSKNTLSEQETDVHPVASIEQANEPAATDTTIPSILSETSVSQADNAQSAVETEILYPETTIETPTIKSEEHVDEPAEVEIASTTNIEEPSEAPIEILPTDETPETSPEAVLDSDATFQLPSVSPQEATEHSNVQIDEVAQPTLESGEQPVDVDQYNSESSEQHAVEVPSEVAETSEEFALQPGASSELADSTTPAVQDTPAPSDVADGKETGTHSATGGTEKTLLHTERPTIVKTQNRPRPRTRKKNNRASVEKR